MASRKFRKKPVVVEAEQWFPWQAGDSKIAGVCLGFVASRHPATGYTEPHVHTLEGVFLVSDGDWIVTGTHGEKYPVKPAIFETTYEEVEQ